MNLQNLIHRSYIYNNCFQVCDVISKWETALREKGMGKFENKRVIRFVYQNRLFWRKNVVGEVDKERLLFAYQISKQIVNGQFPINKELAFELSALMAQVRNYRIYLKEWIIYNQKLDQLFHYNIL